MPPFVNASSINWDLLDSIKYRDEAETVAALLAAVPLSEDERVAVRAEAIRLVEAARALHGTTH